MVSRRRTLFWHSFLFTVRRGSVGRSRRRSRGHIELPVKFRKHFRETFSEPFFLFFYSIGTLGFLYSDEVEDVRGNQGLWDQALALEWIQENIRYFGGDPSRVTIMGESAGGWSVSLQILSPVARGFFRNAIQMSGAALHDKFVVKPEQYVPKLLTGIRKVGCANEEDTSITAKVVDCLRALDAQTVDQLLYVVDKHSELGKVFFV